MTEILITGATGFVGKQVLKHCSQLGASIHAVVKPEKQQYLLSEKSITRIITSTDIFSESADWWAEISAGIDIVIHLAWYVEPGLYLQSSKNLDCLTGTIQLAKGVAQAGVKRFIGIGTCFEYDISYGMLSINTPLLPLTPYAATKAAAFMTLSQWLPLQNIEFAWCRLFYLYGENEDPRRLVSYLHQKLATGEPVELSSGKQIRDFLDVNEAGRLITETALGEQQGAVNICSGIPITVRKLAEQIADVYGRRDLLKFGTRPDNLIDPACIVGMS